MKTRLTIFFVALAFAGCIAGNTVGGVDGGGTPDGATPDDSGAEDSGRAPDSGQSPDSGTDAGYPDAGVDGGCGADSCGACQVGCITTDRCLPGGTWQCGCDCSQGDAGTSCTTAAQCAGTGSSVTSCPSSVYSCVGGSCEWTCGPTALSCSWDAGVDCIECTNGFGACGCYNPVMSTATVEQSTCPGVSQAEVWTLYGSNCDRVFASVGAVSKGSWSWVQGNLVGTLAGTGSRLCFGEMLPTGAIRAVFGCGDCQVQLVFQ